MIRIDSSTQRSKYCDGMTRRSFVQLGVAGMASAGLSDVLRARDESVRLGLEKKDTSVILIWLDGGPSHIDMYDMKPDAPSEYRGIWRPIDTNVSGIQVNECFPKQAKVADKFSIVRSLHHETPDHFVAAHWLLTGRKGGGNNLPGENPSIGSITSKTVGARQPGVPPYACVPHAASIGIRPGYTVANYLGAQHNPYEPDGDPNLANFKARDVDLLPELTLDRLQDRRGLLKRLDDVQRNFANSGTLESLNSFQQQAYDLVSSPAMRKAFDLSSEDPKVRDRYGRSTWGQSTLLARRLVEAGSTFVTVLYSGFDHHAGIKTQFDWQLPIIDSGVSTLLTDLEERGLREKVLVVMCGEFGRTPKMNKGGPGVLPGRDHWPGAMFALLGGGGIEGGRVVGATDSRGAGPIDRPLRPTDLHATIYDVLGVDPSQSFLDYSGRPVPILDHGEVIRELM